MSHWDKRLFITHIAFPQRHTLFTKCIHPSNPLIFVYRPIASSPHLRRRLSGREEEEESGTRVRLLLERAVKHTLLYLTGVESGAIIVNVRLDMLNLLDLVSDNYGVIRTYLNMCDRVNLQRTCQHLAHADPGRIVPNGWCACLFPPAKHAGANHFDPVRVIPLSKEVQALLTVFVRSGLYLRVMSLPPRARWVHAPQRSIEISWHEADIRHRVLFEYDNTPIHMPSREDSAVRDVTHLAPKSVYKPSALLYPVKVYCFRRYYSHKIAFSTFQWTLEDALDVLEEAYRLYFK